MRPRTLLPMLLTGAALAACGARSTLLDVLSSGPSAAGTGGAGGAGATSSSAGSPATGTATTASSTAVSSSSGTGGMPSCPVLTQTGAEIVVPAIAGFHARRPALVPLGAGSEVALVLGLDTAEGPDLLASPIADVAFDAWSAWPAALDAPHQVSPAGGTTFKVSSRLTATYALFFTPESADPAPPAQLALNVDPAGTAVGVDSGLLGTPIFLSSDGDSYMIGVDTFSGDTLHEGSVYGPNSVGDEDHACAAGPIVGDAITATSLVTLSTSVPIINCIPSGFQPTGAVDIRIYLGSPPDDLLLGIPIERLRLLPRKEGAWSLSQTRALDGTLGGVLAVVITSGGHVDPTTPTLVAPPGSGGFAAASLGDGFALAWVASPSTLGLGLFDALGAPAGAVTLHLGASANVTGPLALITSPDASALVVAWSEQSAGAAAAQIHLMRFGCLTPF